MNLFALDPLVRIVVLAELSVWREFVRWREENQIYWKSQSGCPLWTEGFGNRYGSLAEIRINDAAKVEKWFLEHGFKQSSKDAISTDLAVELGESDAAL